MDNIINSKFLKKITQHKERYIIYALGAIILLTLAIRYAEPVRDGDFFWHVKYGEQLMENRTLVPDHSLYSWTPTDNRAIKCNWLSDIFLYLMNRTGGLPLLFAFRYFCMLAVVTIIWFYIRRMEQSKNIFSLLVISIVLLASFVGAYLKPEIISMVFMAISAFLYFSVKSGLGEKWGSKPFLLYPLLFLLWVNIHEVFIFGLSTLMLITAGEIINSRFCKKRSLDKEALKNLIYGAVLSGMATFITPYGYNIHLKYINKLLSAKEELGFKIVTAYNTLFQTGLCVRYDFINYWGIMIITFLFLFAFTVWKRKEWDWAILLPSVFLAFLFARYVRATYYWPSFWGMSVIYMQKNSGLCWSDIIPKPKTVLKPVFQFTIIILVLYFNLNAIYRARYFPVIHRWMGFGISYQNPVQASAFLKKYRPGKLLYNSYDTGGYLIYDLYPLYKVFMDPRYFPYKDWFEEYWNFNAGQTALDDFVKKYPFDVALLDYTTSGKCIIKFLESSRWRPVFYGQTAIVFVKRSTNFNHDIQGLDKHRFDDLHTLTQAKAAFFTAQNLYDIDTSDYILNIIKQKFSDMPGRNNAGTINTLSLSRDGLKAYMEGDYEKAFNKLRFVGINWFAVRSNRSLLNVLNWKACRLIQEKRYQGALSMYNMILAVAPKFADGLYNAGVLNYILQKKHNTDSHWNRGHTIMTSLPLTMKKTDPRQNLLKLFLKTAPDHPYASKARLLLEGKEIPSRINSDYFCNVIKPEKVFPDLPDFF